MSKGGKLTLDDLKDLKIKKEDEPSVKPWARPIPPDKPKPTPKPRHKGSKPPKSAAPVAKEQPESPTDTDMEFFVRAMTDVKPLDGGGRAVAPERPPLPPLAAVDIDDSVKSRLQDLVDGKIEFELDGTSEYIQGRVLGLDSRLFQQLKAGGLSIEAHLDLHGQNADQAQASLYSFMRDSYLNGKRCVLVIPGRGKNSPDGLGVLRSEVQNWLTKDPLKRVVLAFCTAQPRHGGAGALYVLVRKFKQSQGKIIFDRFPLDMM